jgi:hypothetical protein
VKITENPAEMRDRADKSLAASIERLRKGQDPMKRRGRAYGLGERNPDTLPYVYGYPNRSETAAENEERTRYWKALGAKVRKGARIGRHLP